MYHAEKGLVISSNNYSDSDKIYKVFSRDNGLITVIGKGVRKINSRRSPNLDTLNLVSLSLYKKNDYYYVNDVSLVDNYASIKSNLVLTSWVYYIFESMSVVLVEGETENQLYNSLLETLGSLNTNPSKRIVYKYLQNLIKSQGFWDFTLEESQPYLKLIQSSESVSVQDQAKIDSFFISILEDISEKKIHSTLLIKSLQ